MGFLRRRKSATQETDWPLLVATLALGHELRRTEDAGLPNNPARASAIRDAVFAEVGGYRIVHAFMHWEEEMQTDDMDAVIAKAMEESGYFETRNRLFPNVP